MDQRIEALRPGEEILGDLVYLPTNEAGELVPSPAWQENLHRYQLYTALMLGGSRVICPPKGTQHPLTGKALKNNSYLKRLPGETSVQGTGGTDAGKDAWEQRRDSSAHDPVAARIIWVYVDTVARQQIDREAVRQELGDEVVDDIDLRGTAAEDWFPLAYAWGLSQGWCAAQIDLPELEIGDYPSAGHLEAAGQRPYVQLILPSRFWDITLDRFGRVSSALIHEAEGRWRYWSGSACVALDVKGEPLSPPRVHSFGRPPFEIFAAQDPDPDDALAPIGESAMGATALIDLQILQHMSLEDDLHRKIGFPVLHIQLDNAQIQAGGGIMLGPGLAFGIDAEVEWKAPPAESSKEVREHIITLENRALKIGGVHRRSQESVEAHSGLALDWENAPIYATVQRWARRMHDWEVRIWKLMARAMGKDPRAIAAVYPDDFSTRPIDQDLSQSKSVADIYGGYSAAPGWVRAGIDAKVRRAIQRDVGHVRGVRELLEEPLDAGGYRRLTEAATQPADMPGDGEVSVGIPDDSIEAAAVVGEVQQTALNGAQVSSLKDIVISAASGQIPRSTAVELILLAFPMVSREQAESVLGEIGRGFSPSTPTEQQVQPGGPVSPEGEM